MAFLRWFPLLMLAGCYAPKLDGKFACGVDGSCPSGLSCVVGVCRDSTDGGTLADAATVNNAAPADAATPTDFAINDNGGKKDGGKGNGDWETKSDAMATPKTDAITVCHPAACGAGVCGDLADGCGGSIDCGDCQGGQVCGSTTASVCGPAPACTTATTCNGQKAHCGTVPDGCGGILDCGTCPNGKPCGEKKPNSCG